MVKDGVLRFLPILVIASYCWAPVDADAEGIPFDQIGVEAGKQYQGEGISITATPGGARLKAGLQKLVAEVTREGLWLASADKTGTRDSCRVMAGAVGRGEAGSLQRLPPTGQVIAGEKQVSFVRHQVVEEYSVSVDGVRQDFVVLQKPNGTGRLNLTLEVTGGAVAQWEDGLKLTLDGSGREIAYSRLRVTDAAGRELPARMTAAEGRRNIQISVEDAGAVYPVRIDPTFSDYNWVSMGVTPGPNRVVRAIAFDDEDQVYIGGDFTAIGGSKIKYIAKWNGTAWTQVGEPLNGAVYELIFHQGKLYVGGVFEKAGEVTVNGVAVWDGTAWSGLGGGMDRLVDALLWVGTDLYAGGSFLKADGQPAKGVAKWNGTAWSAVGGGVEGTVRALELWNGHVYAGGYFATAGGVAASNTARWDGTAWSALGAGVDSTVEALEVFNGHLYVGGQFENAGGAARPGVARWDGTDWTSVGGGLNSTDEVYALKATATGLYATGDVHFAEGTPVWGIAKWNGTSWSAVGPSTGPDNTVMAIEAVSDDVWIGGYFGSVSGQPMLSVAKWNGATWSGFGTGTNGTVKNMAICGNTLYVQGYFSSIGGIAASGLAKWDGDSWSTLGSATGWGILTMAGVGPNLYVAGSFTLMGGVSARNIAKWDGTSWSRLGGSFSGGANDEVSVLAVSGTDLYVGGAFTMVGAEHVSTATRAKHIAKWDGSQWSALGDGKDYNVQNIAISGSDVYVSGNYGLASFSITPGPANHDLSKWNGSAWSSMGLVSGDMPSKMVASATDLYVTGYFPSLGGNNSKMAKWNGSSWSLMAAPPFLEIFALAVAGGDLYAGGIYGGIRRWDGVAWKNVGSGLDDVVHTLVKDGTKLYAGGDFRTAGGKPSAFMAQLDLRFPDMDVSSNSVSIDRGDATPEFNDNTNFGDAATSGGSVTHTFTISNAGDKDLILTATPAVSINGADAGHFSVTSQPPSPIAAGESTAFQITFDPSSAGTKNATVSVTSSDADATPFTFAIQGAGLTPGVVEFAVAKFTANQDDTQVKLTVQRTGGTLPFEVTVDTEDGEASSVPPIKAATAPADYTDLAGPARTVAFGEGEMSKDVFVTLSSKSGIQPNKKFVAKLNTPTHDGVLGPIATAAVIITAEDKGKPTLTLSTPAVGAKISTAAPYWVTGKAGDTKGLDRVEVVLNGALPLAAALGAATASTAVPFSLPIMPLEGSNTIKVTAYDLSGNEAVTTRSFTFARRYVLTLLRNNPAFGAVALTAVPASSATALSPATAVSNPKTSSILPGTAVKVTATAAAGKVFKSWLGLPAGAVVLGNEASFTMPGADAAVTAEFVSTPFAALAGSFYGLVQPSGATVSSNATEGLLTGTLTATGSFTGKVWIDGAAQAITAVFYGDGTAAFTASGKKVSSLSFWGKTLNLAFDFGSGVIEASVIKGSDVSEGAAARALYSTANKTPAVLLNSATRGCYTLNLAATDSGTPSASPRGSGYATLDLTNIGAVSFAGVLADGTALTGSSALVAGDSAPVLVPLPTPGGAATNKGGSVSGMLYFDPTAVATDVTAPLVWFRPAAASSKITLYPAGWPGGIDLDGLGALYDKTKKVQTALGLGAINAVSGNAALNFTGGKLTAPISKTNFNINGNAVAKIPASDGSYTLTLNATTGLFNGTFTPNWASPSTTKPAFKGILLQKGTNKGGYGFFLSNAKGDADPESGRVTLRAP